MSFTPPPTEREAVPGWRVAAVVLTTLLVAAGLTVLARVWQVTQGREYRAGPPAAAGQHEVGYVFQRPFELERSAARQIAQQRERLGDYGWVDRERGVIHLPIDRAYQAVLSAEESAP